MRSTLFPQLPQRAFALMLLLPAACVTASAQDDDVLKRFVGEFIEITPGEAPFPGEFQIGSEEGEPSERPVRTVQLRRPFKIGRYEVWQDLYERVTGTNPSRWKGPRNSAERMSWRESNEFCRKATLLLREQKLIADDEVVRLPTEAEWEYCCRAGTETRFSFGSAAQKEGEVAPRASLLDAYAWHTGNAAGNDPEVGSLKPNPWGLHDVHGYLWEFCADNWTASHAESPVDAHQPVLNDSKQCVIRGGSWREPFHRLTSSARKGIPVDERSDDVGFRCVLSKE